MKLFRPRAKQTTEPPVSRAMALYRAGRYAEAVTEARAVARSLPHDDTYAPLALSIVANATGAQGRDADALAIYDEVLPAVGKTFGADHWQTLKLRSDRAQTLAKLGRYAECEAECAAVAKTASGSCRCRAPSSGGARPGLLRSRVVRRPGLSATGGRGPDVGECVSGVAQLVCFR